MKSMLALARTFANLKSGKVWLYVLTPALFSSAVDRSGHLGAGLVVQQMMNLSADEPCPSAGG